MTSRLSFGSHVHAHTETHMYTQKNKLIIPIWCCLSRAFLHMVRFCGRTILKLFPPGSRRWVMLRDPQEVLLCRTSQGSSSQCFHPWPCFLRKTNSDQQGIGQHLKSQGLLEHLMLFPDYKISYSIIFSFFFFDNTYWFLFLSGLFSWSVHLVRAKLET